MIHGSGWSRHPSNPPCRSSTSSLHLSRQILCIPVVQQGHFYSPVMSSVGACGRFRRRKIESLSCIPSRPNAGCDNLLRSHPPSFYSSPRACSSVPVADAKRDNREHGGRAARERDENGPIKDGGAWAGEDVAIRLGLSEAGLANRSPARKPSRSPQHKREQDGGHPRSPRVLTRCSRRFRGNASSEAESAPIAVVVLPEQWYVQPTCTIVWT